VLLLITILYNDGCAYCAVLYCAVLYCAVIVGHDMKSLLFNLLDEFLYKFSTTGFVCKTAKVMNIDKSNFTLLIVG